MDDDEYGDAMDKSAQFHPSDAVTLALDLMAGLFYVCYRSFQKATIVAAMHSNYRTNQSEFARLAGMDIEKITGGEDG